VPAATIARYRDYTRQGFSLGAYERTDARGAASSGTNSPERGWLIGMLIAEKHEWNRTLWIWEFHVAEG